MNKLRKYREKKGLKQADLAQVIGVSLPNYNKKENGDIRFSLLEARKIADFLDTTIEDIFFSVEVSKSDIKK